MTVMATSRILVGIVAAACALPAAAAADRPQDYAAVATVATGAPDGLQRLPLPLPVLQQSRSAGLADVHVFNADGERLAAAFVPARPEAPARDASLPLFAWPAPSSSAHAAASGVRVDIDAAGAVVRVHGAPAAAPPGPPREWLLDASSGRDDEQLVELALRWDGASAGLTRKAALEGSDDLSHWQPLAHATLVDLASPGGARVLRDRIAPQAPLRTPRYLRLRLDEGLALRAATARWRGAAAAPLDRARVRFERPAAAGETPSWELDLHAAIALRRIALSLPQENTVAVVWLEQRNEGDSAWHGVGRHTLYRLAKDGAELVSPPLEVAAGPARYWRLRPEPGGAGLAAPALEAEVQWPQAGLVFLARGARPLQLAVGRERMPADAMTPDSLIPGYQPGAETQLPQALVEVLRPQAQARSSLVERIRSAGPEEQRRWMLWAVLCAAVAVLAWLARGLFKDLAHRD
jgi:hypothetical protein